MRVKAIIGVDCATQPHKIGLARATVTPDGWRVQDAMVCSASILHKYVSGRLTERDAAAGEADIGSPTRTRS